MSGTRKAPVKAKPAEFMSDEWFEQTEEDVEAPSAEEIAEIQKQQLEDE